MTGLDPSADHALLADHLLQAPLSRCAQRQVIIQQPAQQLPPVYFKPLLELRVRERSGICPVQETD